MKCKQCGKEIPDGRMYCDACLADLEQDGMPVVTLSKEDIARTYTSGAPLDLEGYAKSLTEEKQRIFMLLGAVLTYLSPFLSWMKSNLTYTNVSGNSHSATLFVVGGDNGVLSLSQKVILASAVLLMLAGFLMLLRSAKGFVRPVLRYMENDWISYIPCIFVAVALLWFFINKGVRNSWKASVKPDIGIAVCIFGIILYTLGIMLEQKPYKKK